MEILEQRTRLTESEGNISYHQLDDCDFDGVAVLCEQQGWGTEDHRQLCAVLPSANQVARVSGQVIGKVAGMQCLILENIVQGTGTLELLFGTISDLANSKLDFYHRLTNFQSCLSVILTILSHVTVANDALAPGASPNPRHGTSLDDSPPLLVTSGDLECRPILE